MIKKVYSRTLSTFKEIDNQIKCKHDILRNYEIREINSALLTRIEEVSQKLNNANRKKMSVTGKLNKDRKALENLKILSNEEIEEVLNETKLILTNSSIKELHDVQEFHRRLSLSRVSRITSSIETQITELEQLEDELYTLSTLKSELLMSLEDDRSCVAGVTDAMLGKS